MKRKAFALGAMYTVSASVASTLTFPSLTDYLVIESVAHDLRITFDGSTPTAAWGFTLHKDIPKPVFIGPDMTVKIFAKSDDPVIMIQPFRSKAEDND